MSRKCKISIVTVCYNAVETIEETILSVLNQTYKEIEYIIIDGGSKDGTTDIIKNYENKISFWISESDNGIYDAMNKALIHVTGDWVFFLNAGDFFYSQTVLSSINWKDYELETIGGIYGDTKVLTIYGVVNDMVRDTFFTRKSLKLQPRMGFNHQGVFIKTFLAKNVGFDLSYKLCADYNMIYNIFKKGYSYEYVPVFITLREGRDGVSERNKSVQIKEEYRVVGLNNDSLSKCCFHVRILKFCIKSNIRDTALGKVLICFKSLFMTKK